MQITLPTYPSPHRLGPLGGPCSHATYHATLVDADFFPRWRWFKEFGGGIIADWGAHMFDIVQWALGKDTGAREVYASPRTQCCKRQTMMYDNGVKWYMKIFVEAMPSALKEKKVL